MLDRRASTPAMIRHRALEAQKVWGRLRRRLLCKHIPQAERVQRLYETAGSSLLYGAGGT